VQISQYLRQKYTLRVEELIRSKAAEYGVNQDIAVKIAIVESGGNPNAISSTGAIGVFQFTGATANLMGLANRFNTVDNIDAGIRLLVADTRFVGSFNSDVATYLALQIGGPNAKYVLTSDRSTKISELPSKLQNAVRGNLGGKSATVGGYIDANAAALEEKIKAQQNKPIYAATDSSPVAASSPAPVASSNKIPNLPSKKAEPTEPSNKPVIASIRPQSSTPPSSYVATTPSTSVVKETKPTTIEPTYTKPSPPPTAATQVASTGTNSSTKAKQSSPTLDGVVRHKSGMYFNAA